MKKTILHLFQEPPLTCPRRAFSHKRLLSWVICGHWAVCCMKCLLVSGASSMLNTIHLESKVYFDKHGKFMNMMILFNILYFSKINSTGHPPFLAESFQQLKEKILHKELPPPKVKGIDWWYSIISTFMSFKNKNHQMLPTYFLCVSRKQIFIKTISRFS